MKVFCESPIGLEKWAAEEAKQLIGKQGKLSKGLIELELEPEECARLAYASHGIERISALLLDTKFSQLEELEEIAKSLSYGEWVRPEQSFAVDCYRTGEHPFKSPQIEAELGAGVIASYGQEKGIKLKVNLEAPNVTVRARVIDDRLLLGIDLSGALEQRGYWGAKLKRVVSACAAYGILKELGWTREQTLLEPLLRDGTFLIEAGLLAKNVCPGKFKLSFPFEQLKQFEQLELSRLRQEFEQQEIDVKPRLIGYAPWYLRREALLNAFAAGIELKIKKARPFKLPELVPFDLAICCLPDWLEKASAESAIKRIASLIVRLKQAKQASEGARLAFLTQIPELVEEAAKEVAAAIEAELELGWYHWQGSLLKLS